MWRWFVDVAISTDDLAPTSIPPHRGMIAPTREVPAIIQTTRPSLLRFPDELRAEDHDPQGCFRKIAEDREALNKLDAFTDRDPPFATESRMPPIVREVRA